MLISSSTVSLKAGDGALSLLLLLSLAFIYCLILFSHSLTSFLITLFFFFPFPLTGPLPLAFPLEQIRAGCCVPCQDPCVWIQSPGVKIEAIHFPGGERQDAYMLSDREDKSYGGKQGMLYVASLLKNTEGSVLAVRE